MGANNSQQQTVSSTLDPRKGEISGGTETKSQQLSPLHLLLKLCSQGQVALGRVLLTCPALNHIPLSANSWTVTCGISHTDFLTSCISSGPPGGRNQDGVRRVRDFLKKWLRRRRRGRSNGRQGEPSDHNTVLIPWKESGKEIELNRKNLRAVQFSSVVQSCPTLCDPMDCNTPGFPVSTAHSSTAPGKSWSAQLGALEQGLPVRGVLSGPDTPAVCGHLLSLPRRVWPRL